MWLLGYSRVIERWHGNLHSNPERKLKLDQTFGLLPNVRALITLLYNDIMMMQVFYSILTFISTPMLRAWVNC